MWGKHPHILTYMLIDGVKHIVSSDYLAEIKLRESSMNPEVLNALKSPYCRCAMWWFIRTGHPLICRAGKIYPLSGSGDDHDKKIMLVAQKEASTDEPG